MIRKENNMRLFKSIVLLSSVFLAAGCANQGAELNLDNANQYLEPLKENEGNANFNETTITFHINSNVETGKLFSSDIRGKCNVSVKYLLGLTSDLKFIWSDPYSITDVSFTYKEGNTSESGFKINDYLEASFTYSVDFSFNMVNVYNLNVTEISGHMLP